MSIATLARPSAAAATATIRATDRAGVDAARVTAAHLPGVHPVELTGDLTAASGDRLSEAVAGAPAGATILLDCTRLEHLDSGGVGQLVVLLVRARRRRQRVAAFGLSPHHRSIFAVTRLDEVVTVHDAEGLGADGR